MLKQLCKGPFGVSPSGIVAFHSHWKNNRPPLARLAVFCCTCAAFCLPNCNCLAHPTLSFPSPCD